MLWTYVITFISFGMIPAVADVRGNVWKVTLDIKASQSKLKDSNEVSALGLSWQWLSVFSLSMKPADCFKALVSVRHITECHLSDTVNFLT